MAKPVAPPLFGISLVLLAGMTLGSTGRSGLLPGALAAVSVIGCAGLVAGSWLPAWARRGALLAVCAALGCAYAAVRTDRIPMVAAETEASAARAVVVSIASFSGEQQRFWADLPALDPPIRVRVTVRSTETYPYGSVLRIDGTLVPAGPSSDGFNEAGFLRAHDAAGKLLADSVKPTGERAGNRFLRALHDIRSWLLDRLDPIAQAERQVAAGVVLGDTASLSDRLEAMFVRTGTTHMLVASGANVAIVAWMIERLLRPFGVRVALAATALAVLGFVVLAGGEASIVRAAFAYFVVVLAKQSGRPVHQPTLLAAVAFVMVALNPWSVLYNASFQLSFAAIVGLAVLGNWIASFAPVWWFKEFLAPTLAAELATLPILLYSFGQLSPISPVANLLALPLIPAIMVGGVATLAVPWFRPISWLTEGIATVLIRIIGFFAALPWASVPVDRYRSAVAAGAFLLFAIAVWCRHRWPRTAKEDDVG